MKKNTSLLYKCFIAGLVFFCLPFIVQGSPHIMGFELSYQCMESRNDSFQIRLQLQLLGSKDYRVGTCEIPTILAYGHWLRITGGGHFFSPSFEVEAYEKIAPAQYAPCSVLPEDTCFYQITLATTLWMPVIDGNYKILYEASGTSIRIPDFTNVYDVNPALNPPFNSATGIINIIYLTPEAQRTCNSSPQLGPFPATFFCVDEPITIDIPVTDPDGDQLVISFCAPYAKPGNVSGYEHPFRALYKFPTYSGNYPLGPDVLQIDPLTNTIHAFPKETGKFLVGLCIKEYRNGQVLSEVIREIVIQIDSCTVGTIANVVADEQLPDGTFVINACNSDSQRMTLQNISTNLNYINDYYWLIDDDTIYQWNPVLSFNGDGNYEATLYLNPGQECSDTGHVMVHLVNDFEVEFSIDYDTCVAGPVTFFDHSISSAGPPLQHHWTFNDGSMSTEVSPQHRFEQPGTYDIQLQVTDKVGCSDSTTQTIRWEPAPPVILVAPSDRAHCAPLEVVFKNQSWPVDSTYTVYWEFENGESADGLEVSQLYVEPGSYHLYCSITSPLGCFVDTLFENLISVSPPPVADFTFAPAAPSVRDPVNFTDVSREAVFWEWLFDEIKNDYTSSPEFLFSQPGTHKVQLAIEDTYGCTDTLTRIIVIAPFATFFLPNAFTPNGDGLNDEFIGTGYTDALQNFELRIFNRWGELLFFTTNPAESWRGTHPKTGNPLPQGVYPCTVQYQTPSGENIHFQHQLLLLR